MKIKVYTTIEESYRLGDHNSTEKKYFNTSELRDEYFRYLHSYYNTDLDLFESSKNTFNDKINKWSYFIDKKDEELEIIDEKFWINK